MIRAEDTGVTDKYHHHQYKLFDKTYDVERVFAPRHFRGYFMGPKSSFTRFFTGVHVMVKYGEGCLRWQVGRATLLRFIGTFTLTGVGAKSLILRYGGEISVPPPDGHPVHTWLRGNTFTVITYTGDNEDEANRKARSQPGSFSLSFQARRCAICATGQQSRAHAGSDSPR